MCQLLNATSVCKSCQTASDMKKWLVLASSFASIDYNEKRNRLLEWTKNYYICKINAFRVNSFTTTAKDSKKRMFWKMIVRLSINIKWRIGIYSFLFWRKKWNESVAHSTMRWTNICRLISDAKYICNELSKYELRNQTKIIILWIYREKSF